ncbi:MAG: DUF3244 domain-containing protein [Dysgonomonas sp.]
MAIEEKNSQAPAKTIVREILFVILFILTVWGMFATKVFATNSNSEIYDSLRPPKGDLGGNVTPAAPRLYRYSTSVATTTATAAIDIDLTNKILQFSFLKDYGIVKIYIINNRGIAVYQQTLDSSVNTELTADVSLLPQGDYEIYIIDQNNKSAYTSFSLD